MAPKIQKSKEAKMKAAQAGGSRTKKKKWGKGKMREKANHLVLMTADVLKDIEKEVPKQKCITIASMVERYGCGGSLARKVLRHLANQGKIKLVENHSKGRLYTRVTNPIGEEGDE